ncbi:PMS1 protein homolog 1 isoform X1 [Heteronotia binoei]|uniref:PMS1 protein homolog 1 isoform X1 n=1 Tax=Heteronotia binoei TaxID=13085 RepID=UPI00292DBE17|nr:PMS1 protein homolog 1 isoform X1 [Heteronotia binoei]
MKQLPADTVRILSSSQVITSVVSVVKELVENSLDAKATSIDIKLDNYGFDKIEVRDNGEGIKAADVPVMAMKHYTSKISSSEDLERLTTYGFRGEALGSICCTSEVLITTKTAADDFSTQYILDGCGHVTSQKPSHLGQGTTVTVLKLFKNLPVRKQFYSTDKKRKEEIKKIQNLLMAYGIVKPELRLTLRHNTMLIWQKNKVSDHKMAFMAVVGTAVMGCMVPFQHCCEDPEVSLSGFLPKANSDASLTTHSSSERSFIFVNNRPVYQKDILKLVRQYCDLKSSHRSYPIFFVNVTTSPAAVDVNLTPDKSQVLLHDKESICLLIEDILTSLYGARTEAVSCETNATDATSVDTFANEREQTDVPVNEIESCRNPAPRARTSLFSFSNDVRNGETGKNTEVCSKNQTLYNDSPLELLTEKEIPGCETAGDDRVQDRSVNNLPCEDQESRYKVLNDNCSIGKDTHSESGTGGDLRRVTIQVDSMERPRMSKDSSEFTADKWSLGHAFVNSRGEDLEPVQILIPEAGKGRIQKGNDGNGQQNVQQGNNDPGIKKTNINDKAGQITAYDLIKNQIVKKPMSAFELFAQDNRSRVLTENPKASAEERRLKMEGMWEALNEEEKKTYEERAEKDRERYSRQSRRALDPSRQRPTKERERKPKSRLKDCLNDQLKLDKLFHSQAGKKDSSSRAVKTVRVPFAMDLFKQRLRRLEQQESDKEQLRLIHLSNFPDAWIVASDQKITMLNPYRVEEALLFKRLLEDHQLPTQKLDKPIVLSDSLLGEPCYMEVLRNMPKESRGFDGSSYLLDSRLVANGFKIKIMPGASAKESQLEIEGMTTCVPYYGVSDLREILSAVVNSDAKEVYECRPLKVVNYLEGEAVRLSRQLPLYLSKEDVLDTIYRMRKQLGSQQKSCVHGRPFIHYLTDIPQSNEAETDNFV